MKKLMLIACALLVVNAGIAQEKFKKEFLPKQGDIAVGFDVIPVFRFMGNAFNGYGTNGNLNEMDMVSGTAPILDLQNGLVKPTVSIMGKYMLTDNVALRANIGLLFNNRKTREYVMDDNATTLDPLSEDKVTDWLRHRQNGVNLSLGAEYRRGYKRVQGIFGGSVLFAAQGENMEMHYGNKMSDVNQSPTVSSILTPYSSGNSRTLETKMDNQYFLGLTGHIGVEYFMGSKIALGAEVNLTMYKQFGSQSWSKYEEYVTANETIEKRTRLNSPGNSLFHFGTENMGGSLYLIFYF